MNRSRSMLATVNTAEPTLAMVLDPNAMGQSVNWLSPSATGRSIGSPSASAATCVIDV